MPWNIDTDTRHYTLVCASPNPVSISRIGTQAVAAHLKMHGVPAQTFDLQDFPPLWMRKDTQETLPAPWTDLRTSVQSAQALIVCGPVYYYDAGSPYNILMEALGPSLAWKPVLLCAAAGSLRSHLAIGALMQNLIFEHSSFVYPQSVLVTKDDLETETTFKPGVIDRFTQALDGFAAFATATAGLHVNDPELAS
ncbi:MAG: NAD(P)H-dependent oxidoreductase [Rhodovibrio sp.]|nr:NAD(P)H-dependent oxidoreductase [Rhodovibrio sp.]